MTHPPQSGHSQDVVSAEAAQDCRWEPQAAPGAVLSGDFGQIYADYAPQVWRNLRRLGVREVQLEDAVQDVFLVVHKRLAQFEARSSLKTWIIGIAVRVAKDYRRAETRHGRRIEGLHAWLTGIHDPAHTPADAHEKREANQLLHSLLATLPDDQREVLVLVELEELSMHEAAEALGLRLRTCQRRLKAAVGAMSAAVARYLKETQRCSP